MIHFFSILCVVACTFAWFEKSQPYRHVFNRSLSEANERGRQAMGSADPLLSRKAAGQAART